MDTSRMSLLLIAGGNSSRMGRDKRWLEFDGVPLLEWMLRKAQRQPFARRYLCCERKTAELLALAGKFEAELLVDAEHGLGPMEGLRAGLSAMPTEYAVAVSCDMPFFVFSALQAVFAATRPPYKAVLAETAGHMQPLASVYHRTMAADFAAALAAGQRKLGAVIEGVPHCRIPVERVNCLFNANTPADMRLAYGRMQNIHRDVPVVTVSAPVSNTGKTTFIERLIPRLREQGIRVGVVKGDAHGYDIDVKGKDSWRFMEAGADSVAVVSPDGYFIERRTAGRKSLLSVASQLEGVDLVLIESRSHGGAPKVSLWRGLGDPVIDADTVLLFTSEKQPDIVVHQYDIEDIEQAVCSVRFLMGLDV